MKKHTMSQLKRPVKEGRFSDKLSKIDEPNFTDTPDELKLRKLKDRAYAACKKIESSREDLKEAVELFNKMCAIAQKRGFYDEFFAKANRQDHLLYNGSDVSGFDWSYQPNELGEYYICPILSNIDIAYEWWGGGNGFALYKEDDDDSGARLPAKKFVDDLSANTDERLFSDCVNGLERMAVDGDIPCSLNAMDELYDWFVALPGVRLDEGRFAGKIKSLRKMDEGRFAKQIAVLDAVLGRDDDSVVSENTKITLTLEQLKRLVKENIRRK